MNKEYIIIGWWPAWSTLWNFLLKNWIKNVTIVEKNNFPRHHIWESLQPDVISNLVNIWIDINLLKTNFPKKYGAVYKWWKFNDKWTVLYSKELDNLWNDNKSVNNLELYEHWYNVDRSIFDKILLDWFLSKWWKVINDNVVNVTLNKDNSDIIENILLESWEIVKWDVYIDCSWQNSLFSSLFWLKVFDSFLRNSAIYWYYKGYSGLDNTLWKDFQFIENIWDSWFWWIPISYDIVSVWIVYNSSKKQNKDDFFDLLKTTEIYNSVKNATYVDELWKETDSVKYISDWSFLSKRAYWRNWFLLWDSFWFVDPILSWWVSFAMEKAIYLWKVLLLDNKYPEKSESLHKKYELDYKNDVLSYLKMAYLWYQNWNSKW